MPSKPKKQMKKSNLDLVKIEIDPNSAVIKELESVEDMINLKDQEILGKLEVEDPKVFIYFLVMLLKLVLGY